MTTKNTTDITRRSRNKAGFVSLVIAACLAGCGGGGGGGGGTTQPPPPSPPAPITFQASLDVVVAIDRSDGSSVQVGGSSISGATATLP